MKRAFILGLAVLCLVKTFAQANYVTTDGVQTITANKNFTGTFYGFNGYSTNYGLGEGMQSGWLIAHKRIDITTPTGNGNGNAMLYISRTDNSSYINSNGGGVLLALADGPSNWGLPTVAGDAILRAESSSSSLFISAQSGIIKFMNLPSYNGSSLATQSWVSSQNYLLPSSPTVGYIPKYNSTTTSVNSAIFDNAGSIGIGTTTPGPYKLAVEGKIGAREIKVTLANPWADYVFSDKYRLMSFADLDQYIKTNKHLPGMPSASEVEKNGGIEVGATSNKLLEKIEELTLYMLELKQENKELKKLIDDLRSRK